MKRLKRRDREIESDRRTRWKFNQLISIHDTFRVSVRRRANRSKLSQIKDHVLRIARVVNSRAAEIRETKKAGLKRATRSFACQTGKLPRTGNREELDCWIICSGYFDFASRQSCSSFRDFAAFLAPSSSRISSKSLRQRLISLSPLVLLLLLIVIPSHSSYVFPILSLTPSSSYFLPFF